MLLFSGFRSDELTAINQKFNKKKKKKKAGLDSPPESLCTGMPLRKRLRVPLGRYLPASTSNIHARYHRGCIEILNALL